MKEKIFKGIDFSILCLIVSIFFQAETHSAAVLDNPGHAANPIDRFSLSSNINDRSSSSLQSRLKAQFGEGNVKCETSSNAGAGEICTLKAGSVKGYSQPIAIAIPDGVSSPRTLHYHFHGHRGVCRGQHEGASPSNLVNSMKILEQMRNSKLKDSVTIIPISSGKNTFHYGFAARFETIHQQIYKAIAPKNSQFGISGHSGGHVAVDQIVRSHKSQVSSVTLIDATYSHLTQPSLEGFQGPVYASYIPGSDTARIGSALAGARTGPRNRIGATKLEHCQAGREELAQSWNWYGGVDSNRAMASVQAGSSDGQIQ